MSPHLARLFEVSRRGGSRLRALFVAIVMTIAFVVPATALAQTASVRGRVVDAETAEPVGETSVDLITAGGQRISSANCDGEGRFEITGAPAGTYSLVFSRLGYAIRRLDGIKP